MMKSIYDLVFKASDDVNFEMKPFVRNELCDYLPAKNHLQLQDVVYLR